MMENPKTKKDPKTGEELELVSISCDSCSGTGEIEGKKDRYGEPVQCVPCNGTGNRGEWRPKAKPKTDPT